MSQIKIETLTPVHIGNGNFLRNKADFTVFRDEKGHNLICVIDPRKILDLVGAEHLDDWILSIENQEDDIQRFVKQYNKNVTPDDYALRIIWNFVKGIRDSDTIKECMHDGRGMPYIPGSSIKGAIRTAIVSSLAREKGMNEISTILLGEKRRINIKNAAHPIEEYLLGKNPNDVFGFFQVGDAYFEEEECEIAIRMINLNITQSNKLIDKSKSQIVEAISPRYYSKFQMKITNEYYQWLKGKRESLRDLPKSMESFSLLFQLINEHTKELVLKEIEYWKKKNERYEGADEYIESLQVILNNIKNCREGTECVLRIGHGSGWRFITGAWSEDLPNFKDKIIPLIRNKKMYYGYDFPKSRRIRENKSKPIGFVKLSISEE